MTLLPTRPIPTVAPDAEVLFQGSASAQTAPAVAHCRHNGCSDCHYDGSRCAAGQRSRLSAAGPRARPPARGQTPGYGARVAWVDYQGYVHIGSLQTHQQRIVASGDKDPVRTLTVAGSEIFWPVRSEIPFSTIMAYDTATGRSCASSRVARLYSRPSVAVTSSSMTGTTQQWRATGLMAGW